METFRESIYRYGGQYVAVDTLLHAGRSAYQDVLLFRNDFYGGVLVLDGVLQITERDEFIYSEMAAHVPLGCHGQARSVLIVGGGDGGVLEEVLKHPGVERAVLVDIDGVVVDLCRQHLQAMHLGAFDSPRAEVRIEDGLAYARTASERFDVVIVDGPDPIGPGEAGCPLYSAEFFAACAGLLRPGGVLVTQNDVPFHHGRAMARTAAALARSFREVQPFVAPVPTFAGGHMAFLAATNGSVDLARNSAAFEIPDTGYYTPAVHAAAFVVPPYVLQAMRGPA